MTQGDGGGLLLALDEARASRLETALIGHDLPYAGRDPISETDWAPA